MTTEAVINDCTAACTRLAAGSKGAWSRWWRAGLWTTALTAVVGGLSAAAIGLAMLLHGANSASALGMASLIAAIGLATAAHQGLRTWRGRSLAPWAASRIIDGSAEQMHTALELALRWSSRPASSPQLTKAIVADAMPLVRELDLAASEQRRANWQLLGLCVALLMSLFSAGGMHPSAWSQLDEQRTAQSRAPLRVGTLVGDLVVRSEPPKYASLAQQVIEDDADDTSSLRGSLLTVQARPLRPLESMAVQWRQGHRKREVGLQASAGLVGWQARLDENLHYRYVGATADGRRVEERGWRTIEATPDAPPQVDLRAPKSALDVRHGEQVMVTGSVLDDVGLTKVELVVALPGGGTLRRPIAFAAQDKRAEVRETLEVDKLELRAGELATVHLEAVDNNVMEGNRAVSSRRVTLHMFSPDRHHSAVLNDLAALALTWTSRLADRLEGDPSRQRAQLKRALAAHKAMAIAERSDLVALRAVAERLAEDVLSRPASRANLHEIGELLTSRLDDEARALRGISADAPARRARHLLATIKRHHDAVIAMEERAVALMASLARSEHRQSVARQGSDLKAVETRLEKLLKRLKDGDKAASSTEAERLLDALHGQIERMLQSIAQQAPLTPPEHLNDATHVEGAAANLQRHDQALGKVRELLRQGRHAEALAELQRLRSSLRSTLDGFERVAEREKTTADSKMRRLVKRLRASIEQARNEQVQIREEARPLSDEQRRAFSEHLESASRDVLPQVTALIEDARDQVRPRRLGSAAVRSSRPLGQARAALSTAAAALQTNDLDGALRALAEADEQFAGAQRERPQAQGSRIERDLVAADSTRLRAAIDRVSRASALLRETLPRAAQLLSPGARARLRQLQPRQRGTRRRLRRAEQRLRKDASAHPALQRQVGGRLQHALSLMAQSEDSLRDADATRAMQQASEAEAALEEAAQMLAAPGQRQTMPSPGVGFAPAKERADLHGPQPGEGRDYRKKLLEAMRRPAPAGYRERLRRYYEVIAK